MIITKNQLIETVHQLKPQVLNEIYLSTKDIWFWVSPSNSVIPVGKLQHKGYIMNVYRKFDFGWDYDSVFNRAIKDGWVRGIYEYDQSRYRGSLSLNGYDRSRVVGVFKTLFSDMMRYGNYTVYIAAANPITELYFNTGTMDGKEKLANFMAMNESYMAEMAYPAEFNMEEFKSIRSFAGKLKYAQEKLLGKMGRGSSRAVFQIDQEKVMKVALNYKGVEQNAEESEYYKQNYDIIARVFDVADDDTWIEMEMAKRVTPTRFKQLTGLTVDEVAQWLRYQRTGDRGSWYHTPDHIKNLDADDSEFLTDVQNFVFDYDYPVPGDFGRLSSYGEVLRDGQPRIVLIDFGFSNSVKDTYQSSRKKYASAY